MGERENGRARGRHACLFLARPFFLVPTASKRVLRRLVQGCCLIYLTYSFFDVVVAVADVFVDSYPLMLTQMITKGYTAVSRKVVGKNAHATIPQASMGCNHYTVFDNVAVEPTLLRFLSIRKHTIHDLLCHSFNFFWKTVNSKPPTIPFGIVACTFSDNLSRNSCILHS